MVNVFEFTGYLRRNIISHNKLFAAALVSLVLVLIGPVYNYFIIEIQFLPLRETLPAFYPLLFLPLFLIRAGGERKFLSRKFTRGEWRASVFAVLICLLGSFLGITSLQYLGGVWMILFVLKARGIGFHPLAWFIFLLAPPFVHKVSLIIGFPLRLLFSRVAGVLLSMLEPSTRILGNQIIFRDRLYAVDPACQGVSLLVAALLLTSLLAREIFAVDRKVDLLFSGLRSRLLWTAFLIGLTSGLWMTTNVIRIVILVLADIAPEDPRHGLTGLILFVLVTAGPVLLCFRLLFVIVPRESEVIRNPIIVSGRPHGVYWLIIIMAIVFWSLPGRSHSVLERWRERIDAFEWRSGNRHGEVGQYQNKTGARLILKQNLVPFRVGHHPRRCWEGVGYRFIYERDLKLAGGGIVREALVEIQNRQGRKLRYRLYWWYRALEGDSPVISSEAGWRKQALWNNQNFVQVNLYAPEHIDIAPLLEELTETGGPTGRRLYFGRSEFLPD